MTWVKKGQIFAPAGQYEWVTTHAMLPVADHIGGNDFRIYFSGRDPNNRSLTGYADVDLTDPAGTLRLAAEPVLTLGELGAFDDNGVSPTWLTNYKSKKYLYYFGWNQGATVRAAEVSGLAISTDNGATYQRYARVPILERSDAEPFLILVVSCILIENGTWRMWYDSADRWQSPELPRYNIKYAESKDGIHWDRKGIVSVDYKDPNESRVSRASVVKDGDTYKMWYCYAMGSGGYTMGYAESGDGLRFERMDDRAGIAPSASGWDSEMICYPFVFDHDGRRYMLYCGNGYGRAGFGYAVWED